MSHIPQQAAERAQPTPFNPLSGLEWSDTESLSPPQLRASFARGFDARTFSFLTKNVFEFDTTDGTSVEYDGRKYIVPRSLAFRNDVRGFLNSSSLLLETKADYDEVMSTATTLSGSLPIGFEASAKSEVAFHGGLFSSNEASYLFDVLGQSVYRARRLDAGQGTWAPEFRQALGALPRTYSPATAEHFFAFFEAFGTHFLDRGNFGGYAVMETVVKDTLVRSVGKKEIEAEVSVGLKGLAGSASLEANAAYESSKFLEQHRKEVQIKITSNGGIFNTDKNLYFNSIFAVPILILPPRSVDILAPTFRSHAELALLLTQDSDFETAVETAIFAYVLQGLSVDGLIGSGDPIVAGQVRPAAAAGLILVSDGGGPIQTPAIPTKADDTQDPKQVVGLTGGDGFWNGNVLAPVAQGDHFVVERLAEPTAYAKYFTLAPHVLEVGPYELAPHTGRAKTDGFLTGLLHSLGSPSSHRARVSAAVEIDGALEIVGLAEETDQLSFSVPIPKGARYAVIFEPSPTCPELDLRFVPIQPTRELVSPVFGPYETRESMRTYQALGREGFLVCANYRTVLTAASACSTGKQKIVPGSGIEESGAHISRASVEQTTVGSFTLPVTRDAYYSTFVIGSANQSLDPVGPTAKPSYFWIPLSQELG